MKKSLLVLITVLVLLFMFTSCEQAQQGAQYRTVSFRTGIADTVPSQNVAYGAKATAPDSSSLFKEGFEMDGWTLDGVIYDFDSPVIKDITLVAKWDVKCTVIFLDSDDLYEESSLGIEAQIIDYYTKAKKPEDPKKGGYTFEKWVDPSGAEYNFNRPVWDTCLQLRAVWKANEYTYKYDANGADISTSLPQGGTYTYGDSITVAGIPSSSGFSKKGCIFEGWTTDKEGKGDVYTPGMTVKGAVDGTTLYAKWTDPGYSVGSTGPTGGIIIAVSGEAGNSFRYVEAAPEVLGSLGCYGYYRVLTQTLDVKNTAVGCDGDDLGDGKTNTTALIGKMGDSACLEESSRSVDVGGGTTKSYDITGDYAAHMCRNHKVENGGMTYDDWYLPCLWEVWKFYDAVYAATGTGVPTGKYITSTEAVCDDYDKDGETKCWTVDFVTENKGSNGSRTKNEDAKSQSGIIWPVRYI